MLPNGQWLLLHYTLVGNHLYGNFLVNGLGPRNSKNKDFRRILMGRFLFLFELCISDFGRKIFFFIYSKNAPHLESAITLGVFVQMFATANCSGAAPKKCVK